jgi:hypothetical protein
MKPCSCGFYARLYALIHRSLGTIFQRFFRFMNPHDGNTHGGGIVRQNKAAALPKYLLSRVFSTSLSTGVERKVVGYFDSGAEASGAAAR